MSEAFVLHLCGQTLYLIMVLSAPMLVSALIVGLVISILQATTQIQEQTLSFVPKIIVTFMAVMVAGTWISGTLARFTIELINTIPRIAGK